MPEDEEEIPLLGDIVNEPTQYALTSTPTHQKKERKPTGPEGKNKRIWLFAAIGIAIIVIGAGAAFFFFRSQPLVPGATSPAISPAPASSTAAVPPAAPSITIGIQKTKSGLRLVVQWHNLPDGTVKIDVFRAPTQNGTGTFIGSISIASLSPAGGSGSLNISNADQGGYYYGTASGGDGGAPLYDSPPAPPTVIPPASPTSSPPSGPGNNTPGAPPSGGPGGNTPPPQNGNPPPGNNGGSSTTNNGSGDQGTSTNGGNTSTIIYYNPQGGISGTTSTTPSGNFLVQHVDQKIQISWQSLPEDTAKIVVSRSSSDDGPWTAVLTETDIMTFGPYSIQVVDDTLGDPYYYKMDTYDDQDNLIATFGPILLQPLGQ